MDQSMHSTSPASSSRKRPRENETESQRIKREKAAERQRRKRERDRNANAATMAISMGFAQAVDPHHQHPHSAHMQPQHHLNPPHPAQSISAPVHQPPPTMDYQGNTDNLNPDEMARRERVRAAARERQRKHRALVKQRKMRELGIDMGNEVQIHQPPVEEMHYRVGPDGQYQQVAPHELQLPPHPPPMGPGNPHEPPFPQGQPLGGQTFASTLLLSFSCAPLLKQHLLRTLHMTNEELASLEPILADAWERWDQARRAHYAEQAAKHGLAPPPLGGPPYPSFELTQEQQAAAAAAFANMQAAAAAAASAAGAQPPPPATTNGTSTPTTDSPQSATANDFRARFHRSLAVPSPFRSAAFPPGQPGPSGAPTGAPNGNATNGDGASTPDSTSGSSGDAIDPNLAAAGVTGAAAPPAQQQGQNQVNGQEVIENAEGTSSTTTAGTGTSKSESPLTDPFGGDDPDFG